MTKLERLKTFISEISVLISGATAGVVPASLARVILTLGWAAIESSYDVIDIYNGYYVPILKEDLDEWVTDFGLSEGEFRQVDVAKININTENYVAEKNMETLIINKIKNYN